MYTIRGCFISAKTSAILNGTESLAVDTAKLLERKRKVVKTLVGGLGAILKSNKIDVVQGKGSLQAPGKVSVTKADNSKADYEAKNIVLANGSRPSVPPFIKIDGKYVQTTDEALDTQEIPQNIVIIGGGVIGIEMATIYANLGASVTIIELLADVLATEDPDVRKTMRKMLRQRGADVHLKARAKEITILGDKVKVIFEDDGGKVLEKLTDRVLVATGRAPVLDGIDVDRLGLAMDGMFVKVNAQLQTNLPGVYAIGDLVGGMMLAHKASAEAENRRGRHPRPQKEAQARSWFPAVSGALPRSAP